MCLIFLHCVKYRLLGGGTTPTYLDFIWFGLLVLGGFGSLHENLPGSQIFVYVVREHNVESVERHRALLMSASKRVCRQK